VHDRWIPNPSMVREVSVADRRAECTHTYGVQSSTESALTSSTSYSRENVCTVVNVESVHAYGLEA
jgi:hypothetical protein